MSSQLRLLLLALGIIVLVSGCATQEDRRHVMFISVPEQKMLLIRDGAPLAFFQVSTSKYGTGDTPGSYATPLGKMKVARKIGDGAPHGMVFKSRRPTGEILPIDAPGRDPIVTRILWLEGTEARNQNAFNRYIYIHGTPEERNIGAPVSFGCIRMRSRDVAALYDTVGVGARVFVSEAPLSEIMRVNKIPPAPPVGNEAASAPPPGDA